MRNLLSEKDKYYEKFADSMYDEFNRLKYGIASCKKSSKIYLDTIRKDIVNYQSNDDADALTDVSIQHMGWLPVYYPTNDESCDYQPPWADMSRYRVQPCHRPANSIGMSYIGQNNSTNLIEVNTGGCITRINLNPCITINNNTGNSSFVFTQSTPATVWYINHNLSIIPNAWCEDLSGNNLEGTLAVVNANTITITFSHPVTGKAYLS